MRRLNRWLALRLLVVYHCRRNFSVHVNPHTPLLVSLCFTWNNSYIKYATSVFFYMWEILAIYNPSISIKTLKLSDDISGTYKWSRRVRCSLNVPQTNLKSRLLLDSVIDLKEVIPFVDIDPDVMVFIHSDCSNDVSQFSEGRKLLDTYYWECFTICWECF